MQPTRTLVTKTQAKGALAMLRSYYKQVIDPHYDKKITDLPRGKAYERMVYRYQEQNIQISLAIDSIGHEIDRMPD